MKQFFLSYTKKRQYGLLAGDIIVLASSILISYVVRVHLAYETPSLDRVLSKLSPWLSLIIVAHVFSLYLFDQYNLNRMDNAIRSSVFVVFCVWVAGLFISGAFFFVPKYVFGRQVLLIHLVIVSVAIVFWRLLYVQVLLRRTAQKRLAIVGGGQIVYSFIEELSRIPNSGFTASCLCVSDPDSVDDESLASSVKQCGDVISLLESNEFDVLAFDSTTRSFSDNEIRRILQLKYRGKAIYDLHVLYENITGMVPISYVDGRWLMSKDGLQGEISKPYIRVKRLVDISLSCLCLLLFSPLLVIVSIIVKAEGKGGILYRQERLGMGKKPFSCLKFRTMAEDAEEVSGPVWSQENDPRVTGLGRILRKTRLDELPQLFNILKGEMSFVGPRPIREHFAKEMAEQVPFYWLRYDVKPGITGWAQVNGAYAVPDALESFQYELFYLQNMSLFLDVLTIFRTAKMVIFWKGK
jgi:exopolysaccharide biosynthesis polyprenyl glycosylphosphotransferase